MHHCVFCGWSRPAGGTTMLEPACEQCGCTLRADTEADHARAERASAKRRRLGSIKPAANSDTTGVFAGIAVLPFLLPVLGLELGDVVFGLPLILLAFAGAAAVRAARRPGPRRLLWLWVAAAVFLASGASLVGVVGAVTGGGEKPALYLGSLASLALLGGSLAVALPVLRMARAASMIDALLVALAVASLGTYFVAVPGFREGDALLTTVAVVDLFALLFAVLAAVALREHRRVLVPLAAAVGAATLGDCFVAIASTGGPGLGTTATAVLWAVAGYIFALSTEAGSPSGSRTAGRAAGGSGTRLVVIRTLLPLMSVVTLMALAGALWFAGSMEPWGAVMFVTVFLTQLGLAFGRQAYLLVENRRAIMRERAALEEAQRRNVELEALTGLATTMTQTLEEAPIAEQALSVLHLAARATSSALHTRRDDGRHALRAAAGDWGTDAAWAGTPTDCSGEGEVRGARAIVRLRVAARGHLIGTVTLVRGAAAPFAEQELKLLRLLVDELAIALQNARDYREKLEQAIRDPLTGLYNRRFLFEALGKELARTERYGGDASLVIFDVDNFKSINDDHGHATGDQVLREIGRVAESIVRPSDSFARIGGEEFAMLLPETAQLDALLIAERLRTALSRSAILPDRRVTVSGGVASCPHDALGAEELHRRADAALYWAKRNGKDMCAVASEVADGAMGDTEREGLLAHLYALVAGIDAHHLHTRDHSENVAAYAVAIGQELGLEKERIVKLRRAALLHDVGKVSIPRDVLEKPSRLTDDEFEQMKLHAGVGSAMLAHAGLGEEAEWVRHHHERFDGRGYPDGVAGEAIPLEARIIFVADSFEAMTSDRPYRDGMPVEEALAELRRCSGTQFQPVIVETIQRLVTSGRLTVLSLRQNAVGPRTTA